MRGKAILLLASTGYFLILFLAVKFFFFSGVALIASENLPRGILFLVVCVVVWVFATAGFAWFLRRLSPDALLNLKGEKRTAFAFEKIITAESCAYSKGEPQEARAGLWRDVRAPAPDFSRLTHSFWGLCKNSRCSNIAKPFQKLCSLRLKNHGTSQCPHAPDLPAPPMIRRGGGVFDQLYGGVKYQKDGQSFESIRASVHEADAEYALDEIMQINENKRAHIQSAAVDKAGGQKGQHDLRYFVSGVIRLGFALGAYVSGFAALAGLLALLLCGVFFSSMAGAEERLSLNVLAILSLPFFAEAFARFVCDGREANGVYTKCGRRSKAGEADSLGGYGAYAEMDTYPRSVEEDAKRGGAGGTVNHARRGFRALLSGSLRMGLRRYGRYLAVCTPAFLLSLLVRTLAGAASSAAGTSAIFGGALDIATVSPRIPVDSAGTYESIFSAGVQAIASVSFGDVLTLLLTSAILGAALLLCLAIHKRGAGDTSWAARKTAYATVAGFLCFFLSFPLISPYFQARAEEALEAERNPVAALEGVDDISALATQSESETNGAGTDRVSTSKPTGNPAKVYYNKEGAYVVVDDVTNEIVQVSNNIDPLDWHPDPCIVDPYIPE